MLFQLVVTPTSSKLHSQLSTRKILLILLLLIISGQDLVDSWPNFSDFSRAYAKRIHDAFTKDHAKVLAPYNPVLFSPANGPYYKMLNLLKDPFKHYYHFGIVLREGIPYYPGGTSSDDGFNTTIWDGGAKNGTSGNSTNGNTTETTEIPDQESETTAAPGNSNGKSRNETSEESTNGTDAGPLKVPHRPGQENITEPTHKPEKDPPKVPSKIPDVKTTPLGGKGGELNLMPYSRDYNLPELMYALLEKEAYTNKPGPASRHECKALLEDSNVTSNVEKRIVTVEKFRPRYYFLFFTEMYRVLTKFNRECSKQIGLNCAPFFENYDELIGNYNLIICTLFGLYPNHDTDQICPKLCRPRPAVYLRTKPYPRLGLPDYNFWVNVTIDDPLDVCSQLKNAVSGTCQTTKYKYHANGFRCRCISNAYQWIANTTHIGCLIKPKIDLFNQKVACTKAEFKKSCSVQLATECHYRIHDVVTDYPTYYHYTEVSLGATCTCKPGIDFCTLSVDPCYSPVEIKGENENATSTISIGHNLCGTQYGRGHCKVKKDNSKKYECSCYAGYLKSSRLNGTDNCMANKEDGTDCLEEACKNNGTCVTHKAKNSPSISWRCICPDGFVGQRCETNLNADRSSNTTEAPPGNREENGTTTTTLPPPPQNTTVATTESDKNGNQTTENHGPAFLESYYDLDPELFDDNDEDDEAAENFFMKVAPDYYFEEDSMLFQDLNRLESRRSPFIRPVQGEDPPSTTTTSPEPTTSSLITENTTSTSEVSEGPDHSPMPDNSTEPSHPDHNRTSGQEAQEKKVSQPSQWSDWGACLPGCGPSRYKYRYRWCPQDNHDCVDKTKESEQCDPRPCEFIPVQVDKVDEQEEVVELDKSDRPLFVYHLKDVNYVLLFIPIELGLVLIGVIFLWVREKWCGG